MKATLAIILLILSASPSYAEDTNAWTNTDTTLQGIYTVLHVIDWGQTAGLARKNWVVISDNGRTYKQHSESNVILGKKPKESTVHLYFATTLVATTVVSYLLPRPYRSVCQGLGIGVELSVVRGNYNIGVRSLF